MKKRKYSLEFEITVRQKSPIESTEVMPVRLEGIDIGKYTEGKALDVSSLFLVRLDGKGRRCIFDPEPKGEMRYRIPARFDPDYEGGGLCFSPRKGSLVFVAPFSPEKQNYSLYFNPLSDKNENFSAPALVGDGDSFIQQTGHLQTDSVAIPFYCGTKMFGHKGLCISSGTTEKNYFFQIPENGLDKDLIYCGEIRDSTGHAVSGIATFHDMENRGISDIIAGKASDGRIYLYKNNGTNEKPVFDSPRPLLLEDGKPLTVIPFLKDIVDNVYREDGSVNPIYPAMRALRIHGGAIHVYCVPRWFSFPENKKEGLLVGVQNRTLFFEKTQKGFKPGKWLLDKNHEPLMTGRMICPADVNGDDRMELIGGDHIWKIRFFRHATFHKGAPVFEEFSSWRTEPPLYRVAPFCSADIPGELLCGTFSGNVLQMDFCIRKRKAVVEKQRFLTMKNASFGHYMAPLEYVDMNNDGIKDIISGDINGGLYFCRNTGTNRNPFFRADVQLEDSEGPIKIHGGPDPICGSDGYSKPTAAALSSSGRMDLLVGSGFGKIFYYKNRRTGRNGMPFFWKGEILKDDKGNEIGCHHMSAVACGKLFDGDAYDLVVGGSGPIHGHPDADTDQDSWVRYYKGKRLKDGRVVFSPYSALKCNDDKFFCYRPRPVFHRINGKNVMLLNFFIYRPDEKSEDKMLFDGTYPRPLLKGTEPFIPSDIRFASLSQGDPVVMFGTCQAVSYVFREAFILNGGYMKATAVFKRNGRKILSGKKAERLLPVPVKTTYHIPYSSDIALSNIPNGALCLGNFKALSTIPDFPQEANAGWEKRIRFHMAHNGKEFCMRLICPEPETERLVGISKYNNSFANQSDDAVLINIRKSLSCTFSYVFHLTSHGFLTEYIVDNKTGFVIEAFHGKRFITAGASGEIRKNQCFYSLNIPLKKIGLLNGFLLNVVRLRRLYADMPVKDRLPPHEQQLMWKIEWNNNWSWIIPEYKNKRNIQ